VELLRGGNENLPGCYLCDGHATYCQVLHALICMDCLALVFEPHSGDEDAISSSES
jgi:hypothetical protein